jgi:hypothetical protein
MGQVIRLRIALADRAGALAQAATVIGLHGGNIVSIDVHHAGDQAAVDDLIIDFSAAPDIEDLRGDLAMNAATTLVSYQASPATDPVVASMRRVVKLVESGFGDPEGALADAVADLCSSPVAWVSTPEEAGAYEAGRLALERDGAVVVSTSTLPAHLAERLSGEAHLLAVPDPEYPGGSRVVFVARPISSDFTATEIARIEALTDLYNQLVRLVEGRDWPSS